MRSKLRIEYSGNPDLRAALSGRQPGETVYLEVEAQLSDVTPDYAEGDVVEISVEGEGGTESETATEPGQTEEATPKEITPTNEEPAVVAILSRPKR